MIIKSVATKYSENISEADLCIFAIGYEKRSHFLYDLLQIQFPAMKPFVFVFDDYQNYSDTKEKVKELEQNEIPFHVNRYDDGHRVHEKILELVQERINQRDSDPMVVHIDYSSMPRCWYCKLPILLKQIIRPIDKIFFWYAEGEYPMSHQEYPSSGIDAFSCFAGKPSLQIENNRIHVVALGYDIIRTQAILSITDPSYLVACYAYNPDRKGFLENLVRVNEPIISRSAISVALHIKDFESMVSKLCDITNELLPAGDVILIPDGPKPLIFALSLVPDLLDKPGITCLHIARNNEYFEAVDVTPTGTVHGFLMQSSC